MSLFIRRAEPNDAALVHGFVVKLAEYEKLSHEVEATVEQIGAHLFGEDPKVFCEIAELGRFEWWVLDWNEPAIEFYKSQGAVMQDEWTVCRVGGADLIALGKL